LGIASLVLLLSLYYCGGTGYYLIQPLTVFLSNKFALVIPISWTLLHAMSAHHFTKTYHLTRVQGNYEVLDSMYFRPSMMSYMGSTGHSDEEPPLEPEKWGLPRWISI
jgi:hypothetical protein